MRILFLSQRFLLPMDTGGKIRTGKLLEQLARRNEITLVSNYELERDEPYREQISRLCVRFVPVAWSETLRYSWRFVLRLAVQSFSTYPVSVLNDHSMPLRRALERECEQGDYDVVICDFVQSALMFQDVVHQRPCVLFQHNVEAQLLVRHMRRAANPVVKLFWYLQWRRMLRFEREFARRFRSVIAVSPQDQEIFRDEYKLEQVKVIPTGVDVEFYRPDPKISPVKSRMVFCGSMDWLPNEDAMIFFITEVLPLVVHEVPEAHLVVIGRRPSPRLERVVAGCSAVELTGWVQDTRPHLAAGEAFVVPLRIGGGTRLKIYEAMAMGMAVVSTSIGAEGLDVTHHEDIVLADDAVAFAQAIVRVFRDASRRRALGLAARGLVEERFSWSRVAREFEAICLESTKL